MDNKKLAGELLRFGIVGVGASLLQWVIYGLLANWMGVQYLIASVLGFLISTVVNYLLSKIWVFHARENKRTAWEFVQFLITSLIALGINTAVLWLCVDVLFGRLHWLSGLSTGLTNMAGQVIATGVVMVWNYLIRKLWVFRKREEQR